MTSGEAEVEFRRRFIDSLDSGPRVEVYCIGRAAPEVSSHADNRQCIEVFRRVEFRGEPYWLGSLSHSAARGSEYRHVDNGAKRLRVAQDIYHGSPDGPWPSFTRAGGIAEQGLTEGRFNLKCDRCGHTVPVRYANLAPILDVLAANGVPAITMRGLAARIPK